MKAAHLGLILVVFFAAACSRPLPVPLTRSTQAKNIALTQTPASTLAASAATLPVTLTPESGAVAFIVGDWESHGPDLLWIANLDGSGERQILKPVDSGELSRIAWLPGQQWLIVARSGGLWLVSPDGLQLKEITNHGAKKGNVTTFSGSPDGKYIGFVQSDYSQHLANVGIFNVETGVVAYPTTFSTDRVVWELTWSPDSQWLIYGHDRAGLQAIHLPDSTVRTLDISHYDGGGIGSLSWSPDGKWLAIWEFGNGRFAHGWICLGGLTDTSLYLDVKGHSSNPVWSPDGQSVYVLAANFDPGNPHLDLDPRLVKFDLNEKRFVRLIPLKYAGPDSQKTLAISPDSLKLSNYVAEQEGESVFQIVSLGSMSVSDQRVNMNVIGGVLCCSPGYAWSPDNQHLIFVAGKYETPDGTSVQTYGSLYSLDITTGQVIQLSKPQWIKAWAVSSLPPQK